VYLFDEIKPLRTPAKPHKNVKVTGPANCYISWWSQNPNAEVFSLSLNSHSENGRM
jgi:hypothetical protein